MLIMNKGKIEIIEGIELPKQKSIRMLGEKNLQILGNIRSRYHEENTEYKRKSKKRKTQKNKEMAANQTLKKQFNQRNKYLENLPGKILVTLLKMDKKLRNINHKMRKLMTIHKALHPRDDMGRLYIQRKGERVTSSIEDCVDVTIHGLQKYTRKSKERLIITAKNGNNKNNTRTNEKKVKLTKYKWEKTTI